MGWRNDAGQRTGKQRKRPDLFFFLAKTASGREVEAKHARVDIEEVRTSEKHRGV